MSDPNPAAQPRLEDPLEFPTVFVFRVMGPADAGLRDAVQAAVRATLDREAEGTEVRPSSKGKWCSVRVGVSVVDADEVRRLYDALRGIDQVRMVL